MRNSVIVAHGHGLSSSSAKSATRWNLLRAEQDSADKILDVTQGREGEGFELPVEVTKAQLTKAQVVQRILQLEGRQDELEVFLRAQMGFAAEQPVEILPEDLPGEAEQEGANLVAMAMQNNTGAAARRIRRARQGISSERREARLLSRLSNSSASTACSANSTTMTNIFRTFQRNNFNAGIQVQVPIFSARTKANMGLAEVNLDAAKANLSNKKTEVSAEVRQKTRSVREKDAAKEVPAWSCNLRNRMSAYSNRNSPKAK